MSPRLVAIRVPPFQLVGKRMERVEGIQHHIQVDGESTARSALTNERIQLG